MLRTRNCFKFVADAEFLPNQRGAYRSDQKQPELNLSYLILLAYCKQIIHNQRKTVGRAVTINMC